MEDDLKSASKLSPGDGLASVQSLTAGVPQMMDSPNAPGSTMTNTDGTEMNRSQRRMKQRIASDKDKK